jgi:simple sugar transport system ATP-binding protein
MSAPEQQQLEIAKALGRDCRILILDEPTAALSPMHSAALLRWIRSYADQGRSVVLITHKLQDATAVADDVSVLRHGRTVLQGKIADFTETELLTAMLGAPLAQSELMTERARDRKSLPALGSLHAVNAEEQVRRERIVDVSLEMSAGEIIGVAGLEGSGHRLLLRVLAGRHAPSRGTVRIPPRIAFIPEDRQREALATQLDLRENVALRGAGRRTGWSRWRGWSSATRALLRDFDVHAANERVAAHTLSGGNQQRLVLARELADSPVLIVAENPTRGLDARATADLLARLRAARDGGAAIVFYSSDLDELVAHADRIVIAYAGRIREVDRSRDAIGRALVGST